VNVSVAGGTRVEIKGVPQISRIPRLVHNEAMRQCALLRIRDILKERGVTPESFGYRAEDVTHIVAKKTRYEPIRTAVRCGGRVACVKLTGFAGVLNESTQENTTFAKEFSDRVRVIACLTTLPNIAHSDTASETLRGTDWQKLRKRLGATHQDALVLVWGDADDTRTACEEIAIRAREATIGVPSDTRQALQDGTNGFERVLPGAERMYPDTDLPPMALAAKKIAAIRARLPEPVWQREDRYRELGLSEAFVGRLSLSPRANLFDRLVDELKIDPTFAAVVLCERLKAFGRAGLDADGLSDEEILEAFRCYADGRVSRVGVVMVLGRFLREGGGQKAAAVEVSAVAERLGLAPPTKGELGSHIDRALADAEGRRFVDRAARHRWVTGRVMQALLGRVEGKRVADCVAQRLAARPSAAKVGGGQTG
jgi:glutamyl-tRNA(Gln) amidotransferase subunit E